MPHSFHPHTPHIERLADVVALPIGRWDESVRLVFCNSPYLQWAGRVRGQLIGHTLEELFGHAAWTSARPAFERAFRGETTSYTRLLTHLSGAPRWARIQVFPDIEEGDKVRSVFTIATDIHDDVVAREALVAARVRLDRFTDNIPNPLLYLDRSGILRFANKAYCEAYGRRPDQVIDRHLRDVLGDEAWRELHGCIDYALAGNTVHHSHLDHRLRQGPRWLRTSFFPDHGSDAQAQHVVGLYTVTIDVHDLTVAQEELRRSLERDALTDVLSRQAMMARIEEAVDMARDGAVALYFVDLDGFKGVNDDFGHARGDELLVRVGQALRNAVLASDAVGRFGGDEFLVLAAVPDAGGASAMAHSLLNAVRSATQGTALSGRVSASIGYELCVGADQDPMHLLRRADEAMYAAKRLGKNRVMAAADLAVAHLAPDYPDRRRHAPAEPAGPAAVHPGVLPG